MARASTREEFIEKAKKIHGSKYDYSNVVYKGNKIHVEIICPEHGPFWQRPDSHVVRGQGCPFCGLEKQKSLFHGVGINDVLCERNSPAYTHWAGILKRCYPTDSDKKAGRFKGYEGCEICEEWKTFSNFKYWFEHNYIEGYQIDKDILFKGNKIYSPITCLFVPPRINALFVKENNKTHGKCLKGVIYNARLGKYIAQLSRLDRKTRHIGVFNTEEEAFSAYKREKEKYIKEVAEDYYRKGLINDVVYNAMYNYKISK